MNAYLVVDKVVVRDIAARLTVLDTMEVEEVGNVEGLKFPRFSN